MSGSLRPTVLALAFASFVLVARGQPAANTAVGSDAEALAERQIVLAHYRLAQIAAERRHVLAALRTHASQRIEEQRANLRLLRDRLRELAILPARPGG